MSRNDSHRQPSPQLITTREAPTLVPELRNTPCKPNTPYSPPSTPGFPLLTTKYLPTLSFACPSTSHAASPAPLSSLLLRLLGRRHRPAASSPASASRIAPVPSPMLASPSPARVSSRMEYKGLIPDVSTCWMARTKCSCACRVESMYSSFGEPGGGVGRAERRRRWCRVLVEGGVVVSWGLGVVVVVLRVSWGLGVIGVLVVLGGRRERTDQVGVERRVAGDGGEGEDEDEGLCCCWERSRRVPRVRDRGIGGGILGVFFGWCAGVLAVMVVMLKSRGSDNVLVVKTGDEF